MSEFSTQSIIEPLIGERTKKRDSQSRIKQIFYVCLFLLFLYPFSIHIGGSGVSANYLYILFPLAVFTIKGKLKIPSMFFIQLMVLYTIIFFVSFYQYDLWVYSDRKIFSFLIFMSIFLYIFIDIDNDMIVAFKRSIVIFVLIYIFSTLIKYFYLGVSHTEEANNIKDLVGSQRIGFIYLMAFWIVVSYRSKNIILKIFKWAFISVIFFGLLLTFSRASILALLVGIMVYFSYSNFYLNGTLKIRHQYKSQFSQKIIIALSFVMIFLAIQTIFPSAIGFHLYRLQSNQISETLSATSLANHASSPGYRIYILERILEFVGANPYTGSGFFGVWIMFRDLSGSAHMQYSDVLFRTGIFGFAAYIYLLFKLFKYIKSRHQDLFIGFVCVLFYGFLHETFKESQGGFLLTFLIGMMASKNRRQNITTALKSKRHILVYNGFSR
jgi:hypothetical protein